MSDFTPFVKPATPKPTNAPINNSDGDLRDNGPVNYVPDGMDGLMHAEIVDGNGVIVDGAKRDKMSLISSIKDVLEKLPRTGGTSRSARANFLSDMCRIFKLPTTIGSDDVIGVESVLADIEKLPDNVVGGTGEPLLRRQELVIGTGGKKSNAIDDSGDAMDEPATAASDDNDPSPEIFNEDTDNG